MPERRETPRPKRRKPTGKRGMRKHSNADPENWAEGERIAKYLARAGVASRREVERLIEEGVIQVNGRRLTTPAFKVRGGEHIEVRGERVKAPDTIRVWRYHKPAGLITTTQDPEGRTTIFEQLPSGLPRVITIGRLDLTTEGLLLLTNDGGLARALELPKTGLMRTYRVRAHGEITQAQLDTLKTGVTLADGTRFARIEAELERQTGSNNWLTVKLFEGQNREVRKAMEHLGLQVNRLIRTHYGPFELADLKSGAVDEIPPQLIRKALGGHIPDQHLPETLVKSSGAQTRRKKAPRPRRPKPN